MFIRYNAVSIHAPARGATPTPRPSNSKMRFQFTPLREGRRFRDKPGQSFLTDGFNSRPCERGDKYQIPQILPETSFNSRPCERGDCCGGILCKAQPVSIHAPARGATRRRRGTGCLHRVSIHAPARGATPPSRMMWNSPTCFNSRPCERGDGTDSDAADRTASFNSRPCERGDRSIWRLVSISFVSIHAPARGATT